MRMRDIKRWLSGLLCVAMLFSTMSVFGAVPKAKAAISYNGAAAAEWARNNWDNNTKGEVCATFAYRSLVAGGLSMTYTNSCAKASNSVRTQLRNTGAFAEYVLQQSGSGVNKTVNAYSPTNSGKIALGDIIMVYVPASDICQHVYVVADIQSDGLIKVAAWNKSWYSQYTAYSAYENNGTAYQLVCFHYTGEKIDPDPDELGCTTAYAGWYQVTGRDGANVNSRHSKNWGDQVGELAKGEYVYVSKATGTGSGNLGHIMYNGVERYIAMGLFKRMSGSPIGSVDSYGADAGSVWVNGWAFDWDNCESQLTIEVCLDNNVVLRGTANTERSDVNSSYSSVVGSYHGFSLRAGTNLIGSHKMDIYAVNVGSGENKCIGSVWVNIPSSDQEAPAISNVKVSNITTEGYDVSCTVTDNVGVNRVVFPTWTVLNDQDDIAAAWWDVNHTATRGTRNGDTWTFHVNIADHNNERGAYLTHIYAYDDAGNRSCTPCDAIIVPEPYPTITFDACGGKAEFTEKQLERNADGMHYGALPEAWMDGYVFEGWYTEAAGGTRVSRSTAYTAKGNTTLYAQWTPVAADAEKGWSLQDGTLIITAQGAMQDYGSAAQTPWFKDRGDIRRIVVQKGVTTIGDYAFYGCKNVTSVTLPDTVTQIGKLAFYGCENLSTLTVPDSVLVVEDYAFANAAGLQSIVFRGNAPVLGAGIFAGLNLEVRYPTAAAGWTDGVKQSYTGSVRWSGVGASALAAQESDLQLDDSVLAALLADSCV